MEKSIVDAASQPPAAAPEPVERYPFWSYADVALFAGLALPCLLIGSVLVKALIWLLRLHVHSKAMQIVPAQFAGYAFLFAALYMLFKINYHRPFWQSLGWAATSLRIPAIIALGCLLAFVIGLLGAALKTQDLETPMKELFSDRSSVLLLGIFGVTLGPICEELAFRGFLQPLLVRSFGAGLGIVLTALPFGLLHLAQYAWSWRHGVLITLTGIALGCMRRFTGSTRASAIMHGAYNFTFFAAYFSQGRNLPAGW